MYFPGKARPLRMGQDQLSEPYYLACRLVVLWYVKIFRSHPRFSHECESDWRKIKYFTTLCELVCPSLLIIRMPVYSIYFRVYNFDFGVHVCLVSPANVLWAIVVGRGPWWGKVEQAHALSILLDKEKFIYMPCPILTITSKEL